MITLRNKLYESLLDDEDEIIDNDLGIVQTILKDLTNDFYKEYNNKKIIKDEAHLENDVVVFDESIKLNCENNKNHKSVPEYLPGINSIKVNGDFQINPHYNLKTLDDNYICKNLSAEKFIFNLRNTYEFKNINLNITDKHVGGTNRISILDSISRESIYFENINITANLPWMFIFMDTDNLPTFKNVHITGCKNVILKIYCLDLGDKDNDITNKINSILDLKYKSEIFDNKKSELIYRKSDLKSILATLNNDKRYIVKSELFKINNHAKMSDIINNIPKNINSISIYNNNCCITFERDPDNIIKQRLPLISNLLSDGWSIRIMGK